MKALVYLGPGRMELQEVPDAEPGAGQARVRVTAAAICGSDLHGFREASPRRIPPLVMGHEAAGVVEAVAPDGDVTLVGSRVTIMPVVSCGACDRCREGRPNLCPRRTLMGMDFPGAFAEAITIRADQLLPTPAALPDEVAALAEPFANAIHVVDRSVKPDDHVLVIGAGPIGLFAVRAAVLAGAKRVVAVDRIDERLALAGDLGATPVPAEDAAGAVDRLTDGAGADVVIDAVGLPPTWRLALEAVRRGGRVEAIGLGAPEGPLPYHALVTKGVAVTGSFACLEADFHRALELLVAGEPDPRSWITSMALADGQQAFEGLVEGRELKVVLWP